jgi:hypothetical protein
MRKGRPKGSGRVRAALRELLQDRNPHKTKELLDCLPKGSRTSINLRRHLYFLRKDLLKEGQDVFSEVNHSVSYQMVDVGGGRDIAPDYVI